MVDLKEIKIDYNQVKSSVDKMNSTIQSFDTEMPKGLVHENKLDLAEAIERVNQLFFVIQTNYKNLLLKNAASTLESIETMKETDQLLGKEITSSKIP